MLSWKKKKNPEETKILWQQKYYKVKYRIIKDIAATEAHTPRAAAGIIWLNLTRNSLICFTFTSKLVSVIPSAEFIKLDKYILC